MNKLEMIFLKTKIVVFAKNHCEFQVHTVLVCTLYTIKYGKLVIDKANELEQ
jgi:hypothetical protein